MILQAIAVPHMWRLNSAIWGFVCFFAFFSMLHLKLVIVHWQKSPPSSGITRRQITLLYDTLRMGSSRDTRSSINQQFLFLETPLQSSEITWYYNSPTPSERIAGTVDLPQTRISWLSAAYAQRNLFLGWLQNGLSPQQHIHFRFRTLQWHRELFHC